MYNAYKLARDAVGLLTDRELDDEIRLNIKKIVLSHDFAHGIHDLRTRDLGGEYMFEFHLELDGALSLYQAHDYTDEVEKALLKAYPFTKIRPVSTKTVSTAGSAVLIPKPPIVCSETKQGGTNVPPCKLLIRPLFNYSRSVF